MQGINNLPSGKGMTTLFDKIISKEIPADIVYEDEHCLAFNDINPQAPVHILLIPKQPLAKLSDASEDDQQMLGYLMGKVKDIATEAGIVDGFRVVINNGAPAGQSVFHLHLHILGGRALSWPPG